MDLIYTDSKNHELGVMNDYEIDLAYGSEENDFELKTSNDILKKNCYIYIEKTENGEIIGTEYGGIIDQKSIDSEDGKITYTGRTWHGILDGKIIEPLSGYSHYVVDGDANDVLREIINYVGLSTLFEVPNRPSGIMIVNYMFRFEKAYQGMIKMLGEFGAKLKLKHSDKRVEIWAEPYVDYGKESEWDSTQVSFIATENYRPINHIICLGQGDMENRAVIHLFADENGGIGKYSKIKKPVQDSNYILDKSSQVLFGIDERTEILDYPNAEIKENYIVLKKQPGNWRRNYTNYYELNGDKYENIKKEEELRYTALSAAPNRWSKLYSNYFEKDGEQYKAVEGVQKYRYDIQTAVPKDWVNNYAEYFYYYSDGVTEEYRSVQSDSVPVYTLQTRQPSDWEDRYSSYYYRKNDGSYESVEGIERDGKTIAPTWQAKMYYTSSNDTVAPKWKENYYYTQKLLSVTAPTFEEGKFFEETAVEIRPAFVKGIYFQKVYDRYAALVQSGIERLNSYYNSNLIDSKFDLNRQYDVGDIVGAIDEKTKISVWQPIIKKIVTIKNGIEAIDYEVGKE